MMEDTYTKKLIDLDKQELHELKEGIIRKYKEYSENIGGKKYNPNLYPPINFNLTRSSYDNLIKSFSKELGRSIENLPETYFFLSLFFPHVSNRIEKKSGKPKRYKKGNIDLCYHYAFGVERDKYISANLPRYLTENLIFDLTNFVPRESILLAIDKAFLDYKTLFLNGMGGIGKTTIARAYINQVLTNQYLYNHIAYIDINGSIQETDGLIQETDSTLQKRIIKQFKKFYDFQFGKDKENFKQLLNLLGSLPNLLLVIDNFNNNNDLNDLKSIIQCMKGKCLVAGRHKPSMGENTIFLETPKLLQHEAFSLYCKTKYRTDQHSFDSDSEGILIDIFEKCNYHPLLIKTVAGQVEKNGVKFTDIIDILERKAFDSELINQLTSNKKSKKYQLYDEDNIRDILSAFYKLNHLDDIQIKILICFAILPSGKIHGSLIKGLFNPTGKKSQHHNLYFLVNMSWINEEEEKSASGDYKYFYSMHDLVKWMIKDTLRKESNEKRFNDFELIISNLSFLLDENRKRDVLTNHQYIFFAKHLFDFYISIYTSYQLLITSLNKCAVIYKNYQYFICFFVKCANIHFHLGELDSAYRNCYAALIIQKKHVERFEDSGFVLNGLYSLLAAIQLHRGYPKQSLFINQYLVLPFIKKKHYSEPNHPEYLGIYRDIINSLYWIWNNEKSLNKSSYYLDKAYTIAKRLIKRFENEKSAAYAQILQSLSVILINKVIKLGESRDKLEQALKYAQLSVKIAEDAFGKSGNNTDVSVAYFEEAKVLQYMGRHGEASKRYLEGITIRRRIMGDVEQFADEVLSFARYFAQQDETIPRAYDLCQEAILIYKKLPDQPVHKLNKASLFLSSLKARI